MLRYGVLPINGGYCIAALCPCAAAPRRCRLLQVPARGRRPPWRVVRRVARARARAHPRSRLLDAGTAWEDEIGAHMSRGRERWARALGWRVARTISRFVDRYKWCCASCSRRGATRPVLDATLIECRICRKLVSGFRSASIRLASAVAQSSARRARRSSSCCRVAIAVSLAS